MRKGVCVKSVYRKTFENTGRDRTLGQNWFLSGPIRRLSQCPSVPVDFENFSESPSLSPSSVCPQFDESGCVDLELHPHLICQILDEVSGVDWEELLPLKGEYLGIPLQVVLKGKVCQGLAGEGHLGFVEGDEGGVAHVDVVGSAY
jgi:hypothetical protein